MCPLAQPDRCGDTENVFQVTNAASASIHGVELDGRVRLPAGISVSGVVTYTHADVIAEMIGGDGMRTPDSKIPPLSGRVAVRFDLANRRYFIESISDFGFAQTRLSVADEADSRIPEGGTPGYGVVHARGGLRLGDGLVATLTLQNLTNTGYRVHGSGVDAPGFGAVLAVSASAGLP
jgi:outer membrane receptor protein involved in Fe transport